jgi:drug/metabolite transporter (DMT)-like permease
LEHTADRPAGKILLSFAIIYFVWGSTFYAIRVGVHEMPPLLFAAMRFLTAGAVMYGWLLARGERSPTSRQWVAASALGFLIFVCDYGLLFWAEQRVPSGIAAVVLATIPVFIALSEIVLLRTERMTLRLAVALLIGIAGVAVLVSHSFNLGDAPVDALGASALIFAAFSWSISTVMTKRLPLPASKPMSSAAQMLSGGVMLTVISGLAGDFRPFRPEAISWGAWVALAYLIVFGSIIGFTAYVWLLHHESPTKVGTYAYVNPVVAVLVGYLLGGEALGPRTVLGTLCVLVSVVLITRQGAGKAAPVAMAKAGR